VPATPARRLRKSETTGGRCPLARQARGRLPNEHRGARALPGGTARSAEGAQIIAPATRTALIAIDWGTTSARAYRIDAAGAVFAARSAPLGLQAIVDGKFAAALDALLDDWRDDDAPRIACGMIGSRQGWVEAPYVACPADLAGLGSALTRTPRNELAIVPGARCIDADGVPDVMRGEETQIAGAFAADEGKRLAVLPGTHSKWAIVERARLLDFATYMTGELYAVLLAHSILGRMADLKAMPDDSSNAAFVRGVARGLASDGFSHLVFGARTLALAGELAPPDVGDWLSGALIGHEIRSARAWASARGADAARVTVIGGDTLSARYVAALAAAGADAETAPADSAARGLFRIAQHAGLIH
jgi:2-dehydro-3-deoxygalactonokinase